MTWRDDSGIDRDFERELTAGLERLAPRPRRDFLQRSMAAVRRTEQRRGWRLLAARADSGMDWSRLLAVGGVAVAALALGIVIGTSGLLPTGDEPSRTPHASASAPAGWQEPESYTFVMVSSCGERSLLGRFGVTVADGVTTGYEALDEQAALFQGPASNVPTLGEMLRRVAEARDGGVADVSLVTDPGDGHPTEVSIDWLPDAIDDEECYLISEYADAPTFPSAQPTALPASDWGSVTIQPPEGPGDIVVNDGLAWDGGAVLTGQLSGPLAEERDGVEPLAWFSHDGVSWLPASIELPPDGVTAFDIGPVFLADARLLAFGNGRTDASGDFRPLLFESTDDGATWRALDQPLPTDVVISDAIAFGDGYVAVGYTLDTPSRVVVMTSVDGLVWDDYTPQSSTPQGDAGPLYGSLTRLVTNGSILVATGPWYEGVEGRPDGRTLVSVTDGRMWSVGEEPPAGTDPHMVDITYHAGAFIAVGSADGGPAVWWSGDGTNWRRIEIPASAGVRGLSAVASTGDAIVAVGDRTDHAVAWRSISGQRWDPPQRLSSSAGVAVLLRTEAGLLAAGTTTDSTSLGKQPVAWITPAATLPGEPTIATGSGPAPIGGETPGPSATPVPGIGPGLAGVGLDDVAELAGALGLDCMSHTRSLPDVPTLYWVVTCTGSLEGSEVTVTGWYQVGGGVYQLDLTVIPPANADPFEAARTAEAAAAVVSRIGYSGSNPDGAETWVRGTVHRAQCHLAIDGGCSLQIGGVMFRTAPALPGAMQLIIAPHSG